MSREISIELEEDLYEYFENVIDDTKFEDVEQYLHRLIHEHYNFHRSDEFREIQQSEEGRNLDSHLEALGYK